MFFAIGWAVIRSSRRPYDDLLVRHEMGSDEWHAAIDGIDEAIAAADECLFDKVERYLADNQLPGQWTFSRHLAHAHGILNLAYSSNHRGQTPLAVDMLHWLAENGPDSYGLVYVQDEEDVGNAGQARGRDGSDRSNEFRVWRLLRGKVEELDDPFLSPIVPRIDPTQY